LPGFELHGRGKVRDVYRVDDRLLIVATDRLSAFDYVLPTGIPDKGRVLTQLSIFWYDFLRDLTPTRCKPDHANKAALATLLCMCGSNPSHLS
jgi:phosphoribosylaminoimidazole-succinocarboxamide synthase